LLFGKIKRNIFYGFRLPKTLSNDEIWYKANKHVGRDFLVSGIILMLGSLILLLFMDILSIEDIVVIEMLLLIIPLTALILRGVLYLKKL